MYSLQSTFLTMKHIEFLAAVEILINEKIECSVEQPTDEAIADHIRKLYPEYRDYYNVIINKEEIDEID